MANKGCWKNWAIVIPCGCGGAILLVLAIIGIVVTVAMGAIKNTEPYQQGVALAQENARVIEVLGNPVEPGWFLSGNVSVNDASGEASFSVPLEGPEGEATLYIEAEKSAGEWVLDRAVVETESGERIDLLEE
jgi:hypothetical protein